MRILITGNLGYIGVELTSYLRRNFKKIFIIGIDNNYFDHCRLIDFDRDVKDVDLQYYADLRKFKLNEFKNLDAIVHLAAISNDPIGKRFQKPTKKINLEFSKKLFLFAQKIGVKKFVFASSCSIYGKGGSLIKSENDKQNPLTDYAKSKVFFEKFLNQSIKKNKTQIKILRFSTACGLSKKLRLDLVLNDLVTNAFFKKKITLNSSGLSYRPLIDVEDMCRSIHWAILNNSRGVQTVNVGRNENNILIRDLAFMVKKYVPNSKVIINKSSVTDTRSYKVSFKKYKKLSGKFYPKKKIKDVIIEFLKFYKSIDNKENLFENENFFRLKSLEKLLVEKKIDKELFWRKP